jgi:hypothetical protein
VNYPQGIDVQAPTRYRKKEETAPPESWFTKEIKDIMKLPAGMVRKYPVRFTENSITVNGYPGAQWERCSEMEKLRKGFTDAAKTMYSFGFIETYPVEEIEEGRSPRNKLVREGSHVFFEVRVTNIGRKRLAATA